MGLPASGNRCLFMDHVIGRNRVACPPAAIMAFIRKKYISNWRPESMINTPQERVLNPPLRQDKYSTSASCHDRWFRPFSVRRLVLGGRFAGRGNAELGTGFNFMSRPTSRKIS